MTAGGRQDTDDSPGKQTAGRPHTWLKLKVGRVCEVCQRTQATGEFDDTPDCPGRPPK